VYSIDARTGFTFKGRVSHIDDVTTYLKSGYYFGGYERMINRSLYIGDTLYTVSPSAIKANSLKDLKEVRSVDLKLSTPEYPMPILY
jgi:hypothetical protein